MVHGESDLRDWILVILSLHLLGRLLCDFRGLISVCLSIAFLYRRDETGEILWSGLDTYLDWTIEIGRKGTFYLNRATSTYKKKKESEKKHNRNSSNKSTRNENRNISNISSINNRNSSNYLYSSPLRKQFSYRNQSVSADRSAQCSWSSIQSQSVKQSVKYQSVTTSGGEAASFRKPVRHIYPPLPERPAIMSFQNSMSSNSPAPTPPMSTANVDRRRTALVIPLVQPGTPGAPYFTGHNVTEFLRSYNAMCDDSGLSVTSKADRVDRYCEPSIGGYIRTIPEFNNQDWEELCRVLKKEYRKTDAYQQQRTLSYLQQLRAEQDKDVRQYCRLYKTTADYLLDKGQINACLAARQFLSGLPKKVFVRVVKQESVDFDEPQTLDFAKLYKKVVEYCEVEEVVDAEWSSRREGSHGVTVASKEASSNSALSPAVVVPTVTSHAPVVAAAPATTPVAKQGQTSMDDLVEKMSNLVLQKVGMSPQGPQSQTPPSYPALPQPSYPLQQTGLDPARNANQPYQPRPQGPITCYFCGDSGHVSSNCREKHEMLEKGLIHLNEQGRLAVGQSRGNGPEIRLSNRRLQKHCVMDAIAAYQQQQPSQPTVRGIRVQEIADSDTEEEEGSGDMEQLFGVRAARATSHGKAAAPARQGPVLDSTRRVMKERQNKESVLPSTKSMRTGTYRRNPLVQGVDEGDIPESQHSQSTVREEPMMSEAVGQDVDMHDNEPVMSKAGSKKTVAFVDPDAPQKLTKSLTQVKNAGAHQLATALMQQEVSVSVGNLLAGSGELRKLLFSAKEWEHDNDTVIHRRNPPPARSKSVRLVEDAGYEPIEMALCPEMLVGINGSDIRALIDTGAECNLMSANLARKLRLAIHTLPDYRFQAVSYSGATQRFCGMARRVGVEVQGIKIVAHFFIAEHMENEGTIILGAPYQAAARLGLSRLSDGSIVCSVTDPGTDETVEFEIEEPGPDQIVDLRGARKMARINSYGPSSLKEQTE
jgi:hypothetical protein